MNAGQQCIEITLGLSCKRVKKKAACLSEILIKMFFFGKLSIICSLDDLGPGNWLLSLRALQQLNNTLLSAQLSGSKGLLPYETAASL